METNSSAHHGLYGTGHSFRETGDNYTIVVSSFDRFDNMPTVISHWRSCPHVEEVHVVHHHPTRELPRSRDWAAAGPPVVVRWHPENKLSSRFRVPRRGFKTPLVFTIDDDKILDCNLMSAAFRLAVGNKEDLVGFSPRLFNVVGTTAGGGGAIIAAGAIDNGYWYGRSCRNGCPYNTVWTTLGAFITPLHMKRYFDARYAAVRELIDAHTTGEDMLMSVVVADAADADVSCPRPRAVYASGWTPLTLKVLHGQGAPSSSTTANKVMPRSSPPLSARTAMHRAAIRQALNNNTGGVCSETTTVWHAVSANGSIAEVNAPCRKEVWASYACTNV
jgi:hypothetical protein